MKILSIFGTRPEAIKMAPVIQLLKQTSEFNTLVCVTGQHHVLLTQVLQLFDIQPDFNLQVMQEKPSLNHLTTALMTQLTALVEQTQPDRILVHGDTTSAAIAALVAFHHQIPVAHIEAGLRTYQISQPYPEEFNRRMIDLVSDLLFTPTETTARHLQQEHLSGDIVITGNTIMDSLQLMLKKLDTASMKLAMQQRFPFLIPDKKMILVTSHRRENHGAHLIELCQALKKIAQTSEADVIFILHPNPNVTETVTSQLQDIPQIHLLPPQDYLSFIYLMQRAAMIITDSGGIQEEATALNKPTFVWRETTERTDSLHYPFFHVIDRQADTLIHAVQKQLTETTVTSTSMLNNTYGDGQASQRIVSALLKTTTTSMTPSPLFTTPTHDVIC